MSLRSATDHPDHPLTTGGGGTMVAGGLGIEISWMAIYLVLDGGLAGVGGGVTILGISMAIYLTTGFGAGQEQGDGAGDGDGLPHPVE